MWQYNYSDGLYHHGILGQKWGVRRFQNEDGTLTTQGKARYAEYKSDRKEIKQTTRKVAAGYRNLKDRVAFQDADQDAYNKNYEILDEAQRKIVAPWNREKKRLAVQEATDMVEKAGRQWERTKAEADRAEEIYDNEVTNLRNQVNKMISKYGADSVKGINTKTVELGEYAVKDIVKTGITLADLPIIGQMYTANYLADKDYENRVNRIGERGRRKY